MTQLIRENNQELGFTQTWEYDNADNITFHREYPYTTGSLENLVPLKVHQMSGHGMHNWGDLFHQYDEQVISYDETGLYYLQSRYYDPTIGRFLSADGLILGDGVSVQSAALGLAHEMGHAAQKITGDLDKEDFEELVVQQYETPIAKELGEPTRRNYNDAVGVRDMLNSTHYITPRKRPWWKYLFFWNWGKPKIIGEDHNT